MSNSRDKNFDALFDAFHGRDVLLAGNGPTLNLFEKERPGKLITVNAGLQYFSALGRAVDLYWVQDRRMLLNKSQLVKPYLNSVEFLAYNEEIEGLSSLHEKPIPLKMLGYKGFSVDPRIGLYHGYNAIYGVLQIIFHLEVRSISIYGVGLNYFAKSPRFYQENRGTDVDLHRAVEQVAYLVKAIKLLKDTGVSIEIIGESMLKRSS